MTSCGMSGRGSRASRESCRRSCTSEVSTDVSDVLLCALCKGPGRDSTQGERGLPLRAAYGP